MITPGLAKIIVALILLIAITFQVKGLWRIGNLTTYDGVHDPIIYTTSRDPGLRP